MLEREIERSELGHFLDLKKITKDWTNHDAFMQCRRMQNDAAAEKVAVSNLAEIYFWILSIRDKDGGKRKGVHNKG
jgi:hypothetical protein